MAPMYTDVDELYSDVLLNLVQAGELVAPRGKPARELRGVTLRLLNPAVNLVASRARKLNYSFAVAEWLWIVGGRDDVGSISPYNKRIAQFSDDGVSFAGAYGPRLQRDMPHVMRLLRDDPDTRQAVVTTWRPELLSVGTRDLPCTTTWQFFIRNGHLELHTTMRSNDAWLGLPYDIFTFTQLQRMVAMRLGLHLGEYVHHVGSMHLYEENRHAAETLLAATVDNDVPAGLRDVASPTPPTYEYHGKLVRHMVQLARSVNYEPLLRDIMQEGLQDDTGGFKAVLQRRFDSATPLPEYWQQLMGS